MPKHDGPWAAAVRTARGHLTQLEFAALVGVTPTAVSRWERGDVVPSGLARRVLSERFPGVFSAIFEMKTKAA